MLANSTLLETRIQWLLDGYFLSKRTWRARAVHANMSGGLYTSGNFRQNTWKKSEGKLGTLFAIMICKINGMLSTYYLLTYII